MAWNEPVLVNTGDVAVASWANAVRSSLRYIKGTDGAITLDAALSVTGALASTSDATISGLLKTGSTPITLTNAAGKLVGLDSTRFASLDAGSLTNLQSSQLSGALPAISGASLTSIPAASLTGTIADARLSNFWATDTQTLADGTSAAPSIGGDPSGFVFVSVMDSGSYGGALFITHGTGHAVDLAFGSAIASTSSGTAGKFNFYWSGSLYILENQTGGTRTFRLTLLGKKA